MTVITPNGAAQELVEAYELAARLRKEGQLEEAESVLRDALQKADDAGLGDSERIIEPLLLLARVVRQNQGSRLSVTDARSLQRRALSLAEAAGNPTCVADVLRTVGLAEWIAGEKEEALAAMEAARAKGELASLSPAWMQYHMGTMAECAAEFGDPRAVDYACASVELADKVAPGSFSAFLARFTLGRVRLKFQDAVGARAELERARDSLIDLQQRTGKRGGRMLPELESWIERAKAPRGSEP